MVETRTGTSLFYSFCQSLFGGLLLTLLKRCTNADLKICRDIRLHIKITYRSFHIKQKKKNKERKMNVCGFAVLRFSRES